MSTYRIVIDRSLCSGFGTCAELAPHLYEVAADGVAAVRVRETGDPAALGSAAQSPMGAIADYDADGEQAA